MGHEKAFSFQNCAYLLKLTLQHSVCVCAVQRKLHFWSPIKSKAVMDVLGKRWWEDEKVTRGPYKHSAGLGPAVKPVCWLELMFIVPRSGLLALSRSIAG